MTIEERVRIVFENPGLSGPQLAKMLHISRQSVNQIRSGISHRNVLPEFERTPPTFNRRCWNCQLRARSFVEKWQRIVDAKLWCSIDIPESISPYYARECPAFVDGGKP